MWTHNLFVVVALACTPWMVEAGGVEKPKKESLVNADVAKAALEAAPKIIEDFRKGNPTVEHIANTYKQFRDFYKEVIKAGTYSGKWSRLELNVINGLKKDIIFDSAHWDSGKFFVDPEPTVIPPGGVWIALTSNKDWAFTGVTGGLKFRIGKGKAKDCLFAGMTNPMVGTYKHFVSVESCNLSPEHAYDSSENSDIKYKSMGDYQVSAFIRPPKEGAEKRFEYTIVPADTSDRKA